LKVLTHTSFKNHIFLILSLHVIIFPPSLLCIPMFYNKISCMLKFLHTNNRCLYMERITHFFLWSLVRDCMDVIFSSLVFFFVFLSLCRCLFLSINCTQWVRYCEFSESRKFFLFPRIKLEKLLKFCFITLLILLYFIYFHNVHPFFIKQYQAFFSVLGYNWYFLGLPHPPLHPTPIPPFK